MPYFKSFDDFFVQSFTGFDNGMIYFYPAYSPANGDLNFGGSVNPECTVENKIELGIDARCRNWWYPNAQNDFTIVGEPYKGGIDNMQTYLSMV